jgi:hypothetical protein
MAPNETSWLKKSGFWSYSGKTASEEGNRTSDDDGQPQSKLKERVPSLDIRGY